MASPFYDDCLNVTDGCFSHCSFWTTYSIFVYISAIFIGITQALVYPTLTTYLSFVLPKIGRNMLLGLFIACADLGFH